MCGAYNEDIKVKVNLIGSDVMDYDPHHPKGCYDPFKPFTDLGTHKKENDAIFTPHVNRIHKINRFYCKDHHSYIIADNRLTLYPHNRNILINKNTANESIMWKLGLTDKVKLIKEPAVRSVS